LVDGVNFVRVLVNRDARLTHTMSGENTGKNIYVCVPRDIGLI